MVYSNRMTKNSMATKKNILGINGSASRKSSNLSILKKIAILGQADFNMTILDDLAELPHFRTALTDDHVPEKIVAFRKAVSNADGIIICTPEYVFSIPSGLKNAIEWCVSTTVFTDKPIGLITASASGEKGHAELQLIMQTVQACFTTETTLLIQGVKGKVSRDGQIVGKKTVSDMKKLVQSLVDLINK